MIVRGALVALLAAGCERGGADLDARSPREAMRQLIRCSFDGAPGDPTAPQVEAALRRELRFPREGFTPRAGRCEDAMTVRGATLPCLARLRGAWAALLPVAEAPAADPIAIDRAVRHVGDAWSEAQRVCP